MIRKIIHIDTKRCNGCGACAQACHEGAIGMVDGKAKLMREDYCDGLGDCLPACPMDAIHFEEREAPAYDAEAVRRAQEERKKATEVASQEKQTPVENHTIMDVRLQNWPIQLKLAPMNAPCFDGAELLVAADCTAYAYAGFHGEFLKGHVALIGCPKLDGASYAPKLMQILSGNDVRSLSVLRMEVPCCGGLEFAARQALEACGKDIPLRVVTISIDGKILEDA
ncbi:MAG: ATP-binding protein [Aristaeellaceae bacterium]